MFWNTKRDNFSECTESCGIKAKQVRNHNIMKQARNPLFVLPYLVTPSHRQINRTLDSKTKTTTRTRFSQYQVVRAHEPVTFWRENVNWGVDRETNPGSGKRFWQQFMQASKPRPLEWKTTYAMDLLHSPRGIIFIIFFLRW